MYSFGTEDRAAEKAIPPSPELIPSLIFRGDQIKSLVVATKPVDRKPPVSVYADPAIIAAAPPAAAAPRAAAATGHGGAAAAKAPSAGLPGDGSFAASSRSGGHAPAAEAGEFDIDAATARFDKESERAAAASVGATRGAGTYDKSSSFFDTLSTDRGDSNFDRTRERTYVAAFLFWGGAFSAEPHSLRFSRVPFFCVWHGIPLGRKIRLEPHLSAAGHRARR